MTQGNRAKAGRRRGKPRRRFAWANTLPDHRGLLVVALVAPLVLRRLRGRLPR